MYNDHMEQPDGIERTAGLPQALGRLRVAMEDAYTRAGRELGLTAPQAELLCAAMQPTAVGNLAETLHCDRSNVSRLVDRTSERGLVKRRDGEKDGRVSVIELTPEGERLARHFLAALDRQTKALRARWPERRQRAAIDLLNEISTELDTARPPLQPPRRATQREEVRALWLRPRGGSQTQASRGTARRRGS